MEGAQADVLDARDAAELVLMDVEEDAQSVPHVEMDVLVVALGGVMGALDAAVVVDVQDVQDVEMLVIQAALLARGLVLEPVIMDVLMVNLPQYI